MKFQGFYRALVPITILATSASAQNFKYVAFGDSFAAGIGAGAPVSDANGGLCRRTLGAYPQVIYGALGFTGALPFGQFVACSGATAEDIAGSNQAGTFMDNSVDIATISLGGNNVGFGDIINNCVYRFALAGDCDTTLTNSQNLIDNSLSASVQSALQVFLDKARPANDPKPPMIFVTGYGRFWNTQTTACNSANWAYWTNTFADKTFMTVPLRTTMNTMVDNVNAKIQAVVAGFNDPRLKFVDYEIVFAEEHFCERNDIQEPMKSSDSRPSLLFAQYNTPLGQLLPEPDPLTKFPVADNDTETQALISGFLDVLNNGSFSVNSNYFPLAATDFEISSGGVAIPYAVARVFHPTQRGHQIIAHRVMDQIFPALNAPGITNLAVDTGCIYVEDSGDPICAGPNKFQILDQGTDNKNISIFACFPSDTTDNSTAPACQLNATFPSGFGDVIWTADNCLTDASGNQIGCAQTVDESQVGEMINPYFQAPPPPPTGPTGFHVVALKCTTDCDDALEIVPSAEDDCASIAQNQTTWWGAAFPPGPAQTENNADQIPPFSLLSNDQFTVFYVFDDTGFSSQLCGIDKLNITFTNSNGNWTWENTDSHSGTCYDNTGAAPSSCNFQRTSDGDMETYTAQEQLVCVDPSDPGYCAQ